MLHIGPFFVKITIRKKSIKRESLQILAPLVTQQCGVQKEGQFCNFRAMSLSELHAPSRHSQRSGGPLKHNSSGSASL